MPIASIAPIQTGTLSEILATKAPDQTLGDASDIPGVRVEAKGGIWYGDLGFMTAAQGAALAASGVMANVATGARASLNGSPVVWRGQGAGWWAQPVSIPPTVVTLGDSIDAVNCSYSALGVMASGFALKNNGGVSGHTTTQMLARFATSVAGFSPGLVHMKGGTNDVAQGVANSDTLENILTVKNMAENIGADFFLSIMPPRSDSYLSDAYALREKQMDLCAKYGIIYSDPFSDYVDPATGGWVSGASGDNVHPTNVVHVAASAKLKASLVNRYGSTPRYPTPKANIAGTGIISNPLMVADANSDGNADGYSYGGIGTPSLITDSAFVGKMQQYTTAGAGGAVVFQWAASAGIGDVILATAKIKKGTADASTMDFRIQDSAGNRKYFVQNLAGAYTDRVGIMWTQSVASTYFQAALSFSGTTSINIGFGELQIYNLTALGLA